ncbi:ribonuclease J 1 [Peptoclostridium acidaminophilum DSM 3953]|uniref:Ribonuclease J n=1 Tax=Peptoclostridium acidaminophilum DSM 3953 TaxID=1286171 RepID=W8TFF0_PEPAC|nr:ribonuclease J [Peptoclostridium acidaminophilum]AHM56553.1 ribonuclease J 1 [Peptoclostridium acidaminophilum DSM 3953]
MKKNTSKIKIIPLGGMNEIGKNLTAIEYKDEIILIDCGLSFPEEEMLGIDIVIPDISYLLKHKDKVKGIFLTHGHEDHIGALPYFLKKINVPVYGTRLTLGLVEFKLKEHRLNNVKLQVVKPGQMIKKSNFEVEFIRVNHSIADACAIAVHTEIGTLFHTGDFKIDHTPIDGDLMDFGRIAEIGSQGVLLMMADSTNVERPGATMSERTVGATLDEIFSGAKSRIIVATFASNVHRLQQVINSADKYHRKIVVSGRSMVNVVGVASELGYLNVPEGVMIDINEMGNYNDSELVLITTGSQGEPMSALSRMAASEHKKLDVQPGDLVIISANPIPGNEKLVSRVINQLFERGAEVIYEALADIHVSGHACQEELKLMHRLVRPKFFMPVHGEYRHLKQHGELAEELGMPRENILISSNGVILEVDGNGAKFTGSVPSGNILIDGLGVGDVGNIVLRDRRHLSEDGLMVVVVTISKESGEVVAGPDIISRGFVYVRESEDLMHNARLIVKKALENCSGRQMKEWSYMKNSIKDDLKNFLYQKTKRNPMILPIIMEV